MASPADSLQVDGPQGERAVRLSSPDRVLWPAVGVTKRDLADYVVAVGPALIRALGDRPVTLQRFPDGVEGEAFYSKNPPRGVPEWVRTVAVTYPSGRSHQQLVLDEPAAAAWAVQMNTITFHPWPVRTADLDQPDELRIDLDPQPGRGFPDVVRAAHLLRGLLRELGLTGFVKTSGNRGVHVFARIQPDREFLDVRHAVIGIGRELVRRDPDLLTMEWWKEQRGERIFIDFNQSNRDRTIASAYSPRPLPHAPVSTPLRWEELDDVDPTVLTVRTVPDRLRNGGDPWEAMDESVGSLDAAAELWRADVEDRGLGELNFPPDYPKMPGEPPRVQPSRKNAANWADES
ncbi:non-homologous end-joining DNA ligase [Angustibacter sp. McL0619]|uniref:non-homologous end-joining DNA ligase n=1 Tax=Angustibacter sp. McL0619 TaxID=3415676 RepID=UPI003CF07525